MADDYGPLWSVVTRHDPADEYNKCADEYWIAREGKHVACMDYVHPNVFTDEELKALADGIVEALNNSELLVLRAKVEMPCAPAWTEARSAGAAPEEYDMTRFCPADCTCACESCAARAELAEREGARTPETR